MTALFCRNPTTSDAGTVTVENTGLGGVTVRLSGMADQQFVTESDGQFTFTGLRSGTYSVEISGFDMDEVGFGSVAKGATVGVGESKILSFDGTYLRTAGIMGQVSVEGVGLGGVTVTMTGEGEDETDVTDAGGLYGFPKLKAGTYSIAISGYDPDEVEFQTTSKTVTIALGETANEPFIGTLLRTSGISGRVSVEGTGLPNVTVTLAGAAEATYTTKDDGQYAFAGLAEGTYVVSMMNPDADAYNFEEKTSHTVVLGDAVSEIRNFDGTHTRTASVSGVLFIDEVMKDKMLTTGEPSVTAALAPLVQHGLLPPEMLAGLLANAKVNLRGPDLNTMTEVAINADGTYTTGKSLQAGSYQVELPANNEMVAAALAAAGVAFVGESAVVTVDAGGSETVNFPFRITMQTIGVGAVMGNAEMASDPPLPVGDVTLALFPTAQDAEAGTNELGKLPIPTKTDPMTGMAAFHFPREMDTSPGSDETDNIVFVKVIDAGHDDLMVSDRNVIEVQYPGVARVHGAPTSVRLLNVAVNFQFWIKSDKDARGGDMPLAGWHSVVMMGDSEDALMMPDPEDDMAMVNLTAPTEGDEDDEEMGKATVSYRVTPDQLPATFSVTVAVDSDDWQQPMAMGETWNEVGDGLTYTHTGFELPALNTHLANDQGPTYVTFNTQTLTVGVYREADDEPGFSDFQSTVAEGDHRPHADVASDMSVSVMVTAAGRRGLEVYDEWDDDDDPETPGVDATQSFAGGMASFGNLPAGMDFTVQFNEGSGRVAVGGPDSRSDRVQAFGDDLDLGMSTGAFGDMSGAGPEVELCPLTTDTRPSDLDDDDSDCATFGYQWDIGTISGGVGRAVEDLDVSISADTDGHSEAPRGTETDEDGEFSFSGVQDGVYTVMVASSDDYTVTPTKGKRVHVYHDEFEDDEDDDTDFTGTRGSATADFSATQLRLSIKGYVVNDGHEGDNENPDLDQIVRGDEAIAGVELELLTIKEISANNRDTTFTSHGTTETDDDGSYSFDYVAEGSGYYVRTTSTGEYSAVEGSATDGFSRMVAADEYPAVEEGSFDLPYWDYNAGTTMNTKVEVAPDAEVFFVNFALLYVDGSISGRVREASGSPGNITVELIRCETYDTEDEDCSTYDRDNFPTQTRETMSNGSWEFNDLLEGWYEIYVGEAGYLAANIDDDNVIDDDVTTVSLEMHTGLLKGKRDLASGNNFYVYDNGLDDDDDMDGIEVEGTTDPEEDPEDLAASAAITAQGARMATAITGMSSDAITFGSKSVSVEPDVHRDATFKVTTGAGTTLNSWPISSGVATVDLGWNETGSDDEGEDPMETEITVSVTAENGYDDHDYTFSASRMNPVGNELMASDFMLEAPAGAEITADFGEIDEFSVNVAEDADELTFTVELEDIEKQVLMVSMGGDEVEPSSRRRADATDEVRYEVTLASGANTIDLMVTSEDEVERPYQLVVRRGQAPRPTNATLSALALSGVTLNPAFGSSTLEYTANVPHTLASTTVTATKSDEGATVVISPRDANATMAGHQVELNVGGTTIAAAVTAADGTTTQTYEVVVTRAAPTASTDATLSSLELDGVTLDPLFNSGVGTYKASVATTVTSTTVTVKTSQAAAPTPTIMPIDADGNTAGHQVGLGVGETEITVDVTAPDGVATMKYTVTVTRADAPAATPGLDIVGLAEETDLGEGEELSFTVRLTTEPASAVSVGITTLVDAQASTVLQVNGADAPATLRFTSTDWDAPRTVTIMAVEDDTDFEDHAVELSLNPGDYGDAKMFTVNIADDDADGAALSITGDQVQLTEGGEDGEFTVVLAAVPLSNVTVTVNVPDDADFTIDEEELPFTTANWDEPQTVTLTATDDDDAVGAESVDLTFAAEGGGYGDVDLTTVTVGVTVTDDDVAGIQVSATALEVREGASTEYTVQLTVMPAVDPVTVTISDAGDAYANVGSLRFFGSDWDQPQTVTIHAREDTDEENDQVNVTHAVSGPEGSGFKSVTDAPGVNVTIMDNELPQAVVSHTTLNLMEGQAGAYTLSLTKAPAADETVTITVQAAAGLSLSSTTASLTESNWENGVRITVTPAVDNLVEAPGTDMAMLNHVVSTSNSSGDYAEVTSATAVTINISDRPSS